MVILWGPSLLLSIVLSIAFTLLLNAIINH